MSKCRICNSKTEIVVSLGKTPLANSFLNKKDLNKKEIFYPLDLLFCDKCFFLGVSYKVDNKTIFNNNYPYFSSYSKTWLKHCQMYSEEIIKELNLNSNSLVIEIGSNDGCLLEFFKKKDINILGIEPSKNTANFAIKKQINTINKFFNISLAKKLFYKNIKGDLIIANNVIAHNSNPNNFVKSINYILKDNGIVTIEFPHLLNLIKYNQFDTIYHEHYSYFSLHTINYLLNENNLYIFKVKKINTHGGSLRIYVSKNKQLKNDDSLNQILNEERKFGLYNKDTFIKFSDSIKKIKFSLINLLLKIKQENKKIIAYGAPAKGNILLNYCGINKDIIDFTVDLNKFKQGKFLPGTNIPIYNVDKIKEYKPDFILILPWNIKDEIIKQLSFVKNWNCKFIIPIENVLI